ncbi:unnamed protein product [Mytilus coruscus]|uniref:B box-type domain-containing protein n=1 Tax=Mytilus coruscus TaxID=42192 RepID=A0A6J8BG77_MYTCO|nr:unnamed protein product [Mytilus coruscus]
MAFPQSRRQAQVPKPCELCETDTAIKWKCVQCNTHMCDKCKKIHLKVQTSIRHDIVDAYNIEAKKDMEHTIITNNIPCQSHKKFNCMFCRTCDRLVCADCITAFHKKHDLDSIDTVCDERRQNLKQLRSRLFEKVTRYETKERQIQDLKTKYNNFLAESVEKINLQEQLIKVEVSKYANELRKQMESERQRIENSMLEKEKQCEKNKENLLKKQSDIQEVLESEHAVNVFIAHKEFCTNEVPDAPFETLLDETKDFIPQKDNLKNISNLFGSLQKTNLPKGLSQITFDVIKSYTTNINTVEKVLILDDRTVWISNRVLSSLRKINIDLTIKTVKDISVEVYDMARKGNNDIFLSLFDSTNVCLLTTKKGTIKPFLSISPLVTCGIHVTKQNEIILGVKDLGCPFKLTDKSCRKIIIFGMNGKQKQSYEYDKHKQRLFTIPARITSNVNNDILVIDRISDKDWRVVAIDREGQVKWVYQGNPEVNSDKLFYPIDILTTSEGQVLVNDVITNALHVLSGEGDLLTCYAMKDQGIFYQFSMDIDSKGQLWVGCHSGNEQRSDAKLHVVKMHF